MSTKCKSCQTYLKGKFCHKCGEKVLEKNDFYISSILKRAILNLTSFDTKVWKSFKYLILKPGFLTLEYVKGRRVDLMKPFQLFVVCNVLFFMFLSSSDVFQQPAKYYFKYSPRAIEIQNEIVEKGIFTQEKIHRQYDKKVGALSKSAIGLLIPFFALFFYFLNLGKGLEYGKHLIFSVHFLSFFLLFVVLIFVSNKIFVLESSFRFKGPLILGTFVYMFFSIRTFYSNRNLITLLKSVLSTFIILALMIIYRNAISALSLYLISKN